MSYAGKTCPYCKSIITETDEVVLCSRCEAPHHKQCWIENQGCTTFGCNGTIQSPADQPQTTVNSSIVYCTNCGNPSDITSGDCKICGAPLINNVSSESANTTTGNSDQMPEMNPYTNIPPQVNTVNNQQYQNDTYQDTGFQDKLNLNTGYENTAYVSSGYQGSEYQNSEFQNNSYDDNLHDRTMYNTDVANYVQNNAYYYVDKFNRMQGYYKSTTWNWCSFFFSGYWFLYRKMYVMGGAILGIEFLMNFAKPISLIINILIAVLSGIYGNTSYLNQLNREIQYANTLDEDNKKRYLNEKGGTNAAAVLIAFLLMFLFALAIVSGGETFLR